MAGKDSRKRGKATRQVGGTILGFLAGLIVGLTVAVVVAVFVTRAPVPFVNKVGRGEKITEPKSAADAPDPNKPLQSKNRPAGSSAPAGGDSSAKADGKPAPIESRTDGKPAEGAKVASAASSSDAAKAADSKSADAKSADGKAADGKDDKTTYMLQAGAYRSQDDADGMRAKLALLGFEARVQNAEVNGQTLFRVRVGPFAQLEDMNKARSKLAEGGIEASVVRQR